MTQIVVGVDGSEHSEVALRWAAREAELRGGGLHALTAVLVWDLFNQRHADGSKRFDPDYDDARADAALLATLEGALGAEAAASVVRKPVCDVPAQGLLEAAKGADLLVVGARGPGGSAACCSVRSASSACTTPPARSRSCAPARTPTTRREPPPAPGPPANASWSASTGPTARASPPGGP